MYKKIICIFVCTLLIANVYGVFGISEEKINTIEKKVSFAEQHSHIFSKQRKLFDKISFPLPINWPDQKQKIPGHHAWNINSYWQVAQSFVPSKDTLSQVSLYLYKFGEINWGITVSIRENLTGEDLTKTVLKPSFSDTPYAWIVFNFQDINVSSGKKYYIVAIADEGNATNCYGWLYNENDTYLNGDTYGAAYGTNNWTLRVGDCCFVTYSSKTTSLEELSTQFPLFQLIIHKLNL